MDSAVRAKREDLVRRHMADENRLDFEAVLSEMPQPRYEIIPTGAVYDGATAVADYYTRSRTAFPDQRNEIISLRHSDDAVFVEFWLRGTHRGPFAGIPPTGRTFEVRMLAVFTFDGTVPTCERVYFDSLTMLKQLLGGVSWRRPQTMVGAVKTLLALRRGLR